MHAQANILVVDDSPDNLQVLAAVLKQDFKVKVAINGERALALATAPEPPDLILLDVMMPGMDGYEVCTRLKQNPATARIPVLFVSSRDDEEDEAHGLSLGAIDYIVKPIRPSIVQARVRNHIELKRSRDLLERLTLQDHLTGIGNRRCFDDALDLEWQRAARAQAPLSLIAIDIDHFKAYNDHYGHPGGDQCLVQVARTLAASAAQRGPATWWPVAAARNSPACCRPPTAPAPCVWPGRCAARSPIWAWNTPSRPRIAMSPSAWAWAPSRRRRTSRRRAWWTWRTRRCTQPKARGATAPSRGRAEPFAASHGAGAAPGSRASAASKSKPSTAAAIARCACGAAACSSPARACSRSSAPESPTRSSACSS